MKINRVFKTILCIGIITFFYIDSSGQHSSLKDYPMFKNEKQNVFKDSVTNTIYNISVMDSMFKTGKNPFQVISDVKKGDTVIWLIKFLNEEDLRKQSIKSKWIDKEFPLEDFTDIKNNQIKTNDLKGKILIINCWSITCGPCIIEIPYLNTLTDNFNSDKYVFLGITFDDTESIKNFFTSDKLKKILNTQDPKFNFRIIPSQKVLLDSVLGVNGYPTTFIVDQKGIIKQYNTTLN